MGAYSTRAREDREKGHKELKDVKGKEEVPVDCYHALEKEQTRTAEILSLQQKAAHMSLHIARDILPSREQAQLRGHTVRRLPFLVPQAFDERAYVSLSDGQRVSIAPTPPTSIMRSDGGAKKPRYLDGKEIKADADGAPRVAVHFFNIPLWPNNTPHPGAKAPLFSRLDDAFDHAFSALEKELLLCQLCTKGLRMIQCGTCAKGYCFNCAMRTHTSGASRQHDMKVVEPRVAVTDVGHSMLYHLDKAEQASYSVKELLKHLRSAADLKRMQRERAVAREYEEQRAAKDLAHRLSLDEEEGHADAATAIVMMCRKAKAVKVVGKMRAMRQIEEANAATEGMSYLTARIQKLFRQYSTQRWFSSRGVVFDYRVLSEDDEDYEVRRHTSRRKVMTADSAHTRCVEEVQQRRSLERLSAVLRMQERHVEATQLLAVNIKHWEDLAATLRPKQAALNALAAVCRLKHSEARKTPTPVGKTERRAFELMLEALIEPVMHIKERVENLEGTWWWCLNLLRAAHRRQAAMKVRYADTSLRLEWGMVEGYMVGRMRGQMQSRVVRFDQDPNAKLMIAWLSRHMDLCDDILVSLDSQQETIIQVRLTNTNPNPNHRI